MKRGHLLLVVLTMMVLVCVALIGVGGCGGDDAAPTTTIQVTTTPTTEVATTSQATTTTEATTTTTTAPATTSTTSTTVYVPTEEGITEWWQMAVRLLNETPWSTSGLAPSTDPADWGEGALAQQEMIFDGGWAACATLMTGGTLSEAIYAALQETPLAGQDPASYPENAFQLVMALVGLGVPVICPSEAELPNPQLMLDSWQELTGG